MFGHESKDGALPPVRVPCKNKHNHPEQACHHEQQDGILDRREDEGPSDEPDDKQGCERPKDDSREVFPERVFLAVAQAVDGEAGPPAATQ